MGQIASLTGQLQQSIDLLKRVNTAELKSLSEARKKVLNRGKMSRTLTSTFGGLGATFSAAQGGEDDVLLDPERLAPIEKLSFGRSRKCDVSILSTRSALNARHNVAMTAKKQAHDEVQKKLLKNHRRAEKELLVIKDIHEKQVLVLQERVR